MLHNTLLLDLNGISQYVCAHVQGVIHVLYTTSGGYTGFTEPQHTQLAFNLQESSKFSKILIKYT